MFTNAEQSRLTMLRNWVLDNEVTQIAMKERQFWNLAALQPLAEKPWTTFSYTVRRGWARQRWPPLLPMKWAWLINRAPALPFRSKEI